MAVWVPWARVLVAGDYLSPVEIPMVSDDRLASAYLATLDRLEPLVEQAESRRARPRRADRRHARGGDPARGPRLRQALRERGAEAKLPLARRIGRPARRSTRRTRPGRG